MKKFLLVLGLGMVLMSFTLQGSVDQIIRDLKSANAEAVANNFDEYVDIKLLDNDEVKNMSKKQAGIALKQFFTENKVKGFEKVSDREIGSTMYMTGKLLTGDKGYNITVMLKQKGGQYQIITIRIN